MVDTVNVFVFGACTMHGPLMAQLGKSFTFAKYGPIPGTYTFGEKLQALAVLRGERDVPPEIRPLCAMRPNFGPVARAADFKDVDVVLVEASSPIDLTFRGCKLNRLPLYQQIVDPIVAARPEARKFGSLWYRTGLIGMNEEARARAGAELLKFIPDDMENAELMRAVIQETRPSKGDALEGYRRLRELFGRPMGAVIYIFQYMEDGRAVSWPAGFHEELKAAAEQLKIPVFDPSVIVNQYGVKNALKDDRRHYREDFWPVVGKAMVDFAFSIRDGAKALAA
jgi:hypothetical protein